MGSATQRQLRRLVSCGVISSSKEGDETAGRSAGASSRFDDAKPDDVSVGGVLPACAEPAGIETAIAGAGL